MASKSKTPVNKPAKALEPKTALADAMIAAVEEADTTVSELVTTIASAEPTQVEPTPVELTPIEPIQIDPTPVNVGITNMTDTFNTTSENTIDDANVQATEFFADVRDKATDAAEKGKKMAADAVEFSKANIEAMIEAGKIAAKGAQDIGKTNVEFAKQNFAEMQVAVKEMTSVKSPTDFMKLQSEYARKSFDVVVAQASQNTEAMVKLVSDMFQPISNRVAVTTDLFKKAA